MRSRLWQRVTDALADPANPRSLSARARKRRWQEFMRRFPDLSAMDVLDLGGTPQYWRSASPRPRTVTLVNIDGALTAHEQWIRLVVGDATRPPLNDRFDLVVSNSLLEHIPIRSRPEFADSVRRHSDRWWVQTPNRGFPLEPHWLFPFFQYLPVRARIAITLHWPIGHRRARSRQEAAASVREVNLIGRSELARYFPESEIWVERAVGLPKSLVAIRSPEWKRASS